MNAMTPAAPAAERIVVPVALAERSYDILIGRHQLCEAAQLIARRDNVSIEEKSSSAFLFSPTNGSFLSLFFFLNIL